MIPTIKWDGHPISAPGLYGSLDLELYHAANICDGPSISSSGLRTIFNESPAHFHVEWRGNPNRIERSNSRALMVGRAVHHLILGEPFFAKLFAIRPEEYEGKDGVKPWSNNAADCKKWHAARREEGRTVLTHNEIDNIRGMAESLGAHPIIRAGALNGLIERSIFWKDAKTGIWLKSRPDSIPGDSGDFVDLKTTDSVQWHALIRTIGKFGYHQQGALIREAARKVLGIESPTFTLVFVEKTPPWCVRIVTLKDSDLDRGDKQNRIALDQFAACLKSKRWAGPGADREDAEFIELGEFDQKRIDARINILGAG